MAVVRLAAYEPLLKNIALGLGVLSTVAIVQNWYPLNMFLSLPFCMIWIYVAWLHTERQLKWVNILFAGFYVYGIGRYFLIG
ncbi:peptidase [Thioclava sp. A2]|uniref:peptidase n=1 Tax=Thioclava sp. FCG-A2 TaxID=3080562 RepID=UPI002952D992|nr:peptidase [Thioclava sp. A2]MDV7270431.1 peptidase [Thioclava sp. A2]